MPDIPPQVLAQMLGKDPEEMMILAGNYARPIPTHRVVDTQTGQVMGTYSSANRARNAADKLDNQFGGYRYKHEPIPQVKPILGT